MTRRQHRPRLPARVRREIASPLARWVLTALTILAIAAGLGTHALIVGAAAGLCWHTHRHPTPRRSTRR
ncbi:hypothetical protein [Streptomyces iconiensis]|uniref:Uncharacterized protein n=1 Tax=Streptomyces iconiensis TaxID=1384038 RepID=A0ABT6ZRC9_9ACTN|nr:hypothetical protein [Streptomyces iconiensis]MDJ1131216.1 hypothetical protein [Streptomyces iconiensis]